MSLTFTIGELAREFDLTTRAIRFYEDCGLITPQHSGRNRVYTQRFENMTVDESQPLLAYLYSLFDKPEFGCRMGVCNTCALKKNSGAVRHVVSGEINASTDTRTSQT